MKTYQYWTTIGQDEYGRGNPVHVTVTDELPQLPQINQQTTVNAQPVPQQPVMIQPQSWKPQNSATFPILSALVALIGLVAAFATQARVQELQSQISFQTQLINQLQGQVRDRDIQIQSYERMGAILK